METLSAQAFLNESQFKFRTFKREWESFTREAPQKLLSLIKSGIKPTISSSRSGNQLGVSVNFESDMSAAKKYIEKVQDTCKSKKSIVCSHVEDYDKRLQLYLDEGIDSEMFKNLVDHMNEWIDYIPKMRFTIMKDKYIDFETPDTIKKIKQKWKDVSAEEVRKKEAEKYGVSLADLSKHKTYLDAKNQQGVAKTSGAMKKAAEAFHSVSGYKDSAELEKKCREAAAEMKKKEDEEARKRREREEARKREEAERLRIAIEKYKAEVAKINKEKAAYLNEETSRIEQKYADKDKAIKAEYESAVRANQTAAEKASTEKNNAERELEAAGLFAFSKKRQLREDIEKREETIRELEQEKKKLDADYASAQEKNKESKESELKILPAQAGKKFPLPKDPRH